MYRNRSYMCALSHAWNPILLHVLDVLLVLPVSSGSGALHKLMLESALSMMSMMPLVMLEGLCASLVLLESLCTSLVLLASLESCTLHTLPLVHGGPNQRLS